MALPFIVFPLGIAGLAVLGEHLKASRSRWTVLAAKYPGTKSADLDWTRLPGMDIEYREGRTLHRVSYAHTRDRRSSGWANALWKRLFPLGHVAVSPDGLHFKRPAWNFKHPPLMIPWAKIADIKKMKTTALATERLATRIGVGAESFKVPKLMSTVLDGLSPDWACVTLADPKMTFTLPADTIADAFQYVTKPESPSAVAPTPAVVKPKSAPAAAPPRANPVEHLLPGGSNATMALMKELTAALVDYTPEKFDIISCTIKEGIEQGQQALFYEIGCPRFPDEGTTVVNERVHTAATRLVRQMTPAKGVFPGLTIRLEKRQDGRWNSRVKLLAA